MQTPYRYTILIQNEEEGGFSGRCLELPAAVSQGDTIDELRNNMREAIQLVLEHINEKSSQQKSDKVHIETITV
jgi:predicted RNase H-like HicB family nuclease